MLGRVLCRNALHQASLFRVPLLTCNHLYSTASNEPPKSRNVKRNVEKNHRKTSNTSQPTKKVGEPGKEKKQIQAMPSSLTRLVTSTKLDGWPSLTNIAILTSKCHQAGVDMDQVEQFFIRHFRSKSKSDEKVDKKFKREDNFFSKHLLERHMVDDSVVKEYLNSYMEPNIYQKRDKIKLPIKRAEYCVAIMRLAFLLGDMPTRSLENINIVREFIQDRNISDDCLSTVLKLAVAKSNDYKVSSDDREVLLDFICDKRITCSNEGSDNMPSLLILSDGLKMIDSLSEVEELTPFDKTRLLSRYSQICWDQSNFSVALETLQTMTESYLTALLTGDSHQQDKLLSLCLDFVELWQSLSSQAAAQNMKPAMEFLLVVAEMVARKWPGSGLGLFPSYTLFLSVSKAETEAARLVRDKLDQTIVPRLRSEKFERCFLVSGMTLETKLFFTRDYLQRLLLDSDHSYSPPTDIPQQETNQTEFASKQEDTQDDRKIEETPFKGTNTGLAVDLMDIRVMELASEKKNAEMVDLITVEHSKSGLLPSGSALETVLKTLKDCEDLYSLTSLHRLIPSERTEREGCYEAIAGIKLRQLGTKWEEDKIRAWVGLVQLYRKIWTDQNNGDIKLETGKSVLGKCQKYGKLFMEEATLLPDGSQLMKPMQLGCTKVATDFSDLSLLTIYWEALFFSGDIEHHQLSDLILDNVPVLVDKMDINSILDRCHR